MTAAAMDVETLTAEIQAEQAKLAQHEAARDQAHGQRERLVFERRALVRPADEGDTAAKARLAAVRREIRDAQDAADESDELVQATEARLVELREQVRLAQRAAWECELATLGGQRIGLAAEIDALTAALAEKASALVTLGEQSYRLAQKLDRPPATYLPNDGIHLTVAGRLSRAVPRTDWGGRPSAFPAALRQMSMEGWERLLFAVPPEADDEAARHQPRQDPEVEWRRRAAEAGGGGGGDEAA